MFIKYGIKWKRSKNLFWKLEKITGHSYDEAHDRMTFCYENGNIKEVSGWLRECDAIMGNDWFDAMKKAAKKEQN